MCLNIIVELPQGILESPVVDAVPINENARVSIVQAFVLPGPASIDVYSEDRTSWKRYAVYLSKTISVDELSNEKMLKYRLFPNPFTTTTTFSYTLDKPSSVTITIFNAQGQQVNQIQREQPNGEQQVQWNAERLPVGMYYFRIQAGDKVGGGKMVKISDL